MVKKVSESYSHHKVAFILGPLLKMVEAFFDLLIPLFMKAIIDLTAYPDPNDIPSAISSALGKFIRLFGTWVPSNQVLSDALVGGTIILVMGIVGFGLTMITQYIAAKTAISVGTEIRDSLFNKILSLSKKEKDQIGNSKLLTVLNSDSYQVQNGVLYFIRLIVRAPFIILGALVFSFILNVKIGFVFLAIVPLILIVVFVIMNKSSKGYVNIQEQLDTLSSRTNDTLEGSKAIRAFNKQSEENQKYEKEVDSYKTKSLKVSKLNSLINPLTFAITGIATIMVVIFGATSIFGNTSSEALTFASTIIAEVSYLSQIFFTTVQLTNVVLILTKAKVSSKRVDSVLEIIPSIQDAENPITKDISDGEEIIKFNNVYLGYKDGGNYALQDINFTLHKGETLGIIGGTGSGKSSVISLIERFLDTSKGEVLYKGENIKNYSLDSLRNEIGLSPQKASLLKGTIKSNLLVANPSATEEEINNALTDSMAIDFVNEKENGLDSPVEEEGHNFSGGQRQRLNIARALLKNPEILILDDSTSALDLLTDKKVRQNIQNHYQNLTKIIVSQRVSTVKDSDLILVFDEGKLIAQGKHNELLKSCSIYKEIYQTQVEMEGSI